MREEGVSPVRSSSVLLHVQTDDLMGGSGIFSNLFISRQVDLAVQKDVAVRTISDLALPGLFALFFLPGTLFVYFKASIALIANVLGSSDIFICEPRVADNVCVISLSICSMRVIGLS